MGVYQWWLQAISVRVNRCDTICRTLDVTRNKSGISSLPTPMFSSDVLDLYEYTGMCVSHVLTVHGSPVLVEKIDRLPVPLERANLARVGIATCRHLQLTSVCVPVVYVELGL